MPDVALVRHEVENLLACYTYHADSLDAAGVAQLFSEAHVSFAGTVLTNPEDIAEHYRSLFQGAPESRHLLNNLHVEVADDAVQARCRYSRWVLNSPPRLIAMGDYRATFHDVTGRWRFESFSVERTWQE